MPEIGGGSCPGFPATLDTDNVEETSNDIVRLNWGNDVAGCIAAIEACLGVNPQGSYATVGDRIAYKGIRGLAAARPAAATAAPSGEIGFYYSTDTGVLEFSDGTIWHPVFTG